MRLFKQYVPHFCVLAAGSLWGCIGLFSRHLSALGFHSTDIGLVRNVGTLLLLALWFLARDRALFRIRLRHLPWFFGTGIVSVFFFTLCYFRSQQLSSLALAAILLYTAPVFVVLISVPVFREKLTGKKLLALALAFGGCVLASGISGGGTRLTPAGLLLGLGSGLFYGLYSIFARFALKHYRGLTVTFYTFVFASVGSLVLLLAGGNTIGTLAPPPVVWLYILGLDVASTAAPYLLYTRGLQDLGDSGKASILASVEPVVASLVGVLAFGEPFSAGTLGGLICILASVVILR